MSNQNTPLKPIVEILGVNFEGEDAFAYCGKLQWNVTPLGHTKKVTDVIAGAVQEYEETIANLRIGKATESDKIRVYEKATKTILEVALVDFVYDDKKDGGAANNVEAGPALLGILANEVKDFLLILGGSRGAKLSQMRLNLMSKMESNISQD